MNGNTLVVSRSVNIFPFYKRQLEVMGFKNITMTANDRDGLIFLIDEINPVLVIFEAAFYQLVTPYLLKTLLLRFPELNIAVVTIADYPARLANSCIKNGVKSYVCLNDGIEQFRKGMNRINNGECFISTSVQEYMEDSTDNKQPENEFELTEREKEVIKLICASYSNKQAAELLHISGRTIERHIYNIYQKLDVQDRNELMRAAIRLELVSLDEIDFFSRRDK